MKRLLPIVLTVVATVYAIASTPKSEDPNSVIVHEWGTFTSIAGEDGRPMSWLPWNGPNDLPCFVDRFKNRTKSSYSGKVRMETPVLYLYTQRSTRVNVNVQFRQGLITEWFPHAVVTPDTYGDEMTNPSFASTITWNDVKIRPDTSPEFPRESGSSHYYAARSTDAAPLESGSQHEKFLFYRGVGNFDIPISATIEPDGSVAVKNLGSDAIPAMIFFENRHGRIRFRSAGKSNERTVVALPTFNSDFGSLRSELEQALTEAGLYPKEAAAMVETWRDSWFEEGARLLYVVPQSTIESVLPLQIRPAPARTARVFVGRVELITRPTMEQIEQAIRTNDSATLEQYGRFLEPVRSRILAKMPASDRRKAEALLQSVSSAYFAGNSTVCR